MRASVSKSVACGRDIRARVAVAPLEAVELPLFEDAGVVQPVTEQNPENRQAVARARGEGGGGSLREVPRRDRHFGDTELEADDLRHDLLIEDEFIGVHLEI